MVAENLMLLEYIKLLRPRFNAYWCGWLCATTVLPLHPVCWAKPLYVPRLQRFQGEASSSLIRFAKDLNACAGFFMIWADT